MHILFVCTGNTCRSPMAKVVTEKIGKEKKLGILVDSAGLSVQNSQAASANACAVVKEKGMDLSNHISKTVSEQDLQWADIVLTMTEQHKNYLKAYYPAMENKVYTLGEYSSGVKVDVADPFGGSLADYRKCLTEMEKYIIEAVEKWEG